MELRNPHYHVVGKFGNVWRKIGVPPWDNAKHAQAFIDSDMLLHPHPSIEKFAVLFETTPWELLDTRTHYHIMVWHPEREDFWRKLEMFPFLEREKALAKIDKLRPKELRYCRVAILQEEGMGGPINNVFEDGSRTQQNETREKS